MESISININGYDTYCVESTDHIGNHLLISIPPNAQNDISNICGTLVCGHLIKQIGYTIANGIRFIKAYY